MLEQLASVITIAIAGKILLNIGLSCVGWPFTKILPVWQDRENITKIFCNLTAIYEIFQMKRVFALLATLFYEFPTGIRLQVKR